MTCTEHRVRACTIRIESQMDAFGSFFPFIHIEIILILVHVHVHVLLLPETQNPHSHGIGNHWAKGSYGASLMTDLQHRYSEARKISCHLGWIDDAILE